MSEQGSQGVIGVLDVLDVLPAFPLRRDAQLAHTEDQGRAVQTKPDGSAFRAANNPFGLANP